MAARRSNPVRGGKTLASPPGGQASLQEVRRPLRGDWENASRSDLRLLRRAIREGWDVPLENRKPLMEAVLSLLGNNSRRDLTICQLAIEAHMGDVGAEEEARRLAALPPPVTPLGEAERAALYTELEAAIKEMSHGEGPPPLPQQPAAPEPAPAEPVAPAAEVSPPQAPPSLPSPAPLFNPFFSVDPLGCISR
jgi:hypothetical protein